MNNRFKKTFALVVAVLMIVAVLPVSSSAEEKPSDYPFILIHGMMGWGEDQNDRQGQTYWGFGENQDVCEYLRSQGHSVYTPSVGKMSSAWDRACELYAILTGTVVDYGEAHSAAYGHSRYGRDYTGKPIMGYEWDAHSPINLITHSFGGPTAVVFCSLLEYGSAEEVAATGASTSPLFTGGHAGAVYSVSTCEAPLNGTQTADFLMTLPGFRFIFCAFANLMGSQSDPSMDFMFDQWGITADPTKGEKATLNPFAVMKLATSTDHAGYDMTITGAAALNKKFPTAKSTYWFSYSACITQTNSVGLETPTGKSSFLNAMSVVTASRANHYSILSGWVGSEWMPNDGFVPVVSAQAPFGASSAPLSESSTPEKGLWYTNPVDYGVGHGNHVSGTNEVLYGKYDTILRNIDLTRGN